MIRYINVAIWIIFIAMMLNWIHVFSVEFGVPWYAELISGVTLSYVATWFMWRLFTDRRID